MNFKIIFFFFISCLIYNSSTAQIKTGSLKVFTENSKDSILSNVTIELYRNDSTLVGQMKSDSMGTLIFKNLKEGIYYLKADLENCKTFLQPHILVSNEMITFITVKMQTLSEYEAVMNQNKLCFYDMSEKKPKCPICNSKKDVIPYIYGFPSKSLLENKDKGLFVLGGCIVEPCMPFWFCKTDKIDILNK